MAKYANVSNVKAQDFFTNPEYTLFTNKKEFVDYWVSDSQVADIFEISGKEIFVKVNQVVNRTNAKGEKSNGKIPFPFAVNTETIAEVTVTLFNKDYTEVLDKDGKPIFFSYNEFMCNENEENFSFSNREFVDSVLDVIKTNVAAEYDAEETEEYNTFIINVDVYFTDETGFDSEGIKNYLIAKNKEKAKDKPFAKKLLAEGNSPAISLDGQEITPEVIEILTKLVVANLPIALEMVKGKK